MSREWWEGGPKLGMGVVGWDDENWVCAVWSCEAFFGGVERGGRGLGASAGVGGEVA